MMQEMVDAQRKDYSNATIVSIIQELQLVEVGDCYFVKTMFLLKHRSYA